MSSFKAHQLVFVSALALGALFGCDPSDPNPAGPSSPTEPAQGFLSADAQEGELGGSATPASGTADSDESSAGSKSSARTVEEGDIYRVLAPGRLLNLNAYRGLQVVDIADVTKPSVVGRLREAGQPVEMYVVGQRAIVLLNGWSGYYGSRTDIKVQRQTGGLVLSVDLTDPTAPVVTDREFVPGYINTSRLTRDGDKVALYVAANLNDCWGSVSSTGAPCSGTAVKSFDVSSSDMVARTQLDLGGYVIALQATPQALLVARTDYGARATGVFAPPTSLVSVVDISSPTGEMVEGAQVAVSGLVQNKFNLDLRGGVLRVVSGSSWGGGQTNHLQTYDAKDIRTLPPLAHCTFGDNQQLYATLFMADRAFFVTYLRKDPFHAFALDAGGGCQERSEFVVSGWNDFFRPVFDNRRLIGIGTNDEQNRQVAVSLYDVTNLDNRAPLLARVEVEQDNSWSSAASDDKAFSVIENAVSLPAVSDPTAIETGLVLLPFVGYDKNYKTGTAGVQIYTFGERTLSRRGVMNHGSLADRSFQPQPNLTVNLSDQDLSLFDSSDPTAPVERGRVELAPNYTAVHDYGAYLVRINDTRGKYYGWWDTAAATPPAAYAEVIPSAGDPDAVLPVARVAMPAGSRTFKVGSKLVVVSTENTSGQDSTKPTFRSTIQVHDLTDPLKPVQLSTLTTDRLWPAYGYGWGDEGIGCGMRSNYYYDDYSRVVGNAIVFGRNELQQVSRGQVESCSKYVDNNVPCQYDGSADCVFDAGYNVCERPVGDKESSCTGEFVHCTRVANKTTCVPVAESEVAPRVNCYTNELHRSWQTMKLDVLDLTHPEAPTLEPIDFATDEEAVGLVATADSVYFAFKKPVVVPNDARRYAKHFFRQVDVRDPANPQVGAAINVPGELIAVDAQRLLTRDLRWGQRNAETWLHTLTRSGDQVTLAGSKQFVQRDVKNVLTDGKGNVYVSHGELWNQYEYDDVQRLDKLAILRASDLTPRSETEVDTWAELSQVVDGRLLFGVGGGYLIINAQDPAAPYAQAYFPYLGWLEKLTFHDNTILLAGGPYGLYRLDATTHNLLK